MTNSGQSNGEQWRVPTTPVPESLMSPPSTAVTAPRTYTNAAVLGFLSGPWPLGVVAIYYASKVKEEWAAGNPTSQQQARNHSRKARNWARTTQILGIAIVSPGILMIANNLAVGVNSKHVSETIGGIVALGAMLLAAAAGLILAAQHRVLTTIIVGAIVLAVAGASVGLSM